MNVRVLVATNGLRNHSRTNGMQNKEFEVELVCAALLECEVQNNLPECVATNSQNITQMMSR
eukprot:6486412-Amphidinium_carterae.1